MNEWPYPGDSPAARARRVALAYRAKLETHAPEACKDLDQVMRNMGQRWVLPEVLANRHPDEWVTAQEAAEILCIEPDSIRRLRARGRLTGRKGNAKSWQYQVAELEKAFTRTRGRPAKRTDTIPTSGRSVPQQ